MLLPCRRLLTRTGTTQARSSCGAHAEPTLLVQKVRASPRWHVKTLLMTRACCVVPSPGQQQGAFLHGLLEAHGCFLCKERRPVYHVSWRAACTTHARMPQYNRLLLCSRDSQSTSAPPQQNQDHTRHIDSTKGISAHEVMTPSRRARVNLRAPVQTDPCQKEHLQSTHPWP